ncbi:MAG: hypothetical protein A3G80_01050 [Betaproteobacteria bacterium RIFCSPLOWO2_12_FULL_62_13b]|nr:MAG: hypothetical protein A3G80_01050 [Betaproteobacteria bacterium RIFCSPLOWO2_12_FULL_62_13b]
MNHKKRALRVFLADLTHMGRGLATDKMPLGIGLLASYALKQFGSDIDIQLFKYPDRFLHAVQREKYDVVGCTTFNWNNSLAEWACDVAKAYNPNVITIRGGYNFPLNRDQQEQYMRHHKFTDIYCTFEGEVAFCAFLERLLGIASDFRLWSAQSLPGCVFLSRESDCLVVGDLLPRMRDLDQIPSPYVAGLMDQFFDGRLAPMIETSRGCPFSCDFCNSSNDYYNKMAFFSDQYVREELRYITKRILPTGINELTVCDLNFGMFRRDKGVADAIKECQDTYKWPVNILMTTGKNNVSRVMQNIEMFGETTTFTMAVQSMDETTLRNVERSNISLGAYQEMADRAEEKGIPQVTALIVPLPGETYASYLKGIEELLACGAKKLTTHTLQLNYGTVYKDPEYRKRYGYEGNSFYRLIPYDFGIYGGRKVFDVEEVAVATASMTFREYLEIRKLVLVLETLYNRAVFKELFRFLSENGITSYALVLEVLNNIQHASRQIRECFDSFVQDTRGELFGTEGGLVDFYSETNHYQALETGEIGGNVLFKHTGMLVGEHEAWVGYVFACARSLLERGKLRGEGSREEGSEQGMNSLRDYIGARLKGVFDSAGSSEDMFVELDYDIMEWVDSKDGKSLQQFRGKDREYRFRFYFDEKQRALRDDVFARYGTDRVGASKIQARVPFGRLVRKVEKMPQIRMHGFR